MLKPSTGTEIYVVPNNLTQLRVFLIQFNNIPAGRCQPSFRGQLGAGYCDAALEPHTDLPFCLRMVHIKLNSTGSLGVRRGRSHCGQTTSSALTCCIGSVCISVASWHLCSDERGSPDRDLDEGMLWRRVFGFQHQALDSRHAALALLVR
jgi:hypothetical protein